MDDLRARLSQAGAVLFVGTDTWRAGCEATLLESPRAIIETWEPGEVPGALAQVDEALREGLTVAGFVAFEAGRAFGLSHHEPWSRTPLVWMACYEPNNVRSLEPDELPASADFPVPDVTVALNISRQDYCAAIAAIKEYIAAGDTYQVNYTCHARFEMLGDPARYFLAMLGSHPVPYAAWLNLGDAQVLSLSPELLLRKRGRLIATKPMKGTRPRGRTLQEDADLARDLVTSVKDRAENLMIVDMMRNDLGRFCELGSVRTPVLFEAEKYGTVWQMTSTVVGTVPQGSGVADVFAATFPGASVTGAPKKRTLEIIRELEPEPRGVYCGAIGLFMPGGDFTCNLPIRTLVHRDSQYDLGIGAGIVWDSDEQAEYDETLLKSTFAFRIQPAMELFETLLLNRDREYAHLQNHIARLLASADYWDFAADEQAIRDLLAQVAAEAPDAPVVVRLSLNRAGRLTVSTRPAPDPPTGPATVRLSTKRVDSGDRLLYHKTNRRDLYDRERQAATDDGLFEVIFANERDCLTEGAITNIFLRIDGHWVTPPITEGLLPGIWRQAFIDRTGSRQEPLPIEALSRAEEVLIGNSVRGSVKVGRVLYGEQALFSLR